MSTVRDIADADVASVIDLWGRAGLTRPWNDPATDIAFARRHDNSTVLVMETAGAIIASVMVGHDGHRGYVYYLAVEPARQGAGLGKAMMAAAENWLRARGLWKLQLLVRRENTRVLGFYESLGYYDTQTVLMQRWIDPEAEAEAGAAQKAALGGGKSEC